MVAYSGNKKAYTHIHILIPYFSVVLTDPDFKSSQAYQLLKEVQKEVYSSGQGGFTNGADIESAQNLNQCKDKVTAILNGFLSDPTGSSTAAGGKKPDKVSKA